MGRVEKNIPEFEPIRKALEQFPTAPPPFSQDWFEMAPGVLVMDKPAPARRWVPLLAAASLLLTASIAYFAYGYLQNRSAAPVADARPHAMVVVLFVKGQVSLDRNGTPLPVSSGSAMHQDDRISASTDSSADLLLPDRSIVRLRGPGSLVLGSVGEKIRLIQENGITYHSVEPSTNRQSYEVQTPTAVAGVRGTRFRVEIRGQSTLIAVTEGKVLVSPPEPRGSEVFAADLINAGESGMIGEQDKKIEKKTATLADDTVVYNEMQQSQGLIGPDLIEQVSSMKDTADEAEIQKIYNRPLETLVMADGRVLKGVVASQNGNKLILHTTHGIIVIPVEDLAEIQYQK